MKENLIQVTYDNTHFSNPISSVCRSQQTLVGEVQTDISDTSSATLPEGIKQYLSASIANSTRKAYQTDLADFYQWGGGIPCQPETVAAYLAERAQTLSPVTLSRRLVALGRAHASQGLPDPTKTDLVRTVLRGVKRVNGIPQRQVTPVLKADLLAMLPLMTGTKGVRDRALLLLGFAAALRRSELVALDVSDLTFVKEGLIIYLRRSKTDQEGIGRKIGVPYGRSMACPVKAIQQWLEHGQITAGPIFRSVNKSRKVGNRLTAHSVALIIKRYAEAVGLDPDDVSGHSLRSGLVTSAAHEGIAAHRIMAQTGHRSIEMLNRYIREANLFLNNAGGIL